MGFREIPDWMSIAEDDRPPGVTSAVITRDLLTVCRCRFIASCAPECPMEIRLRTARRAFPLKVRWVTDYVAC